MNDWVWTAIRRLIRVHIYADSFFSLVAPTADTLEEYVVGIREAATNFARQAAALRKGVLWFYVSPLHYVGSPEMFNMSLRTRSVEMDFHNAQKVLDLLTSISQKEALHHESLRWSKKLCDDEDQQYVWTSTLHVFAWTFTLRHMLRSAVVDIRLGRTSFSIINGVRQRMEARKNFQRAPYTSSLDTRQLPTLMYKLHRCMKYADVPEAHSPIMPTEGFMLLFSFMHPPRENELALLEQNKRIKRYGISVRMARADGNVEVWMHILSGL